MNISMDELSKQAWMYCKTRIVLLLRGREGRGGEGWEGKGRQGRGRFVPSFIVRLFLNLDLKLFCSIRLSLNTDPTCRQRL